MPIMSPVMAKALVDVSAESNRGVGQTWRRLEHLGKIPKIDHTY